jgi:hypothetical protein
MSEEQSKDKLSQMLSVDTESDENVRGLVQELTNVNNIETKTDLTPNQIVVMSRAIWFARRYGIDSLDLYTRKVMLKLAVSKGRGGRADIVNALTGVFQHAIARQKSESVKV